MKLIWLKIRKLLLELFVVFLGVYLAFQLNNYKENLSAKKVRNNYYSVVLQEFETNLLEIIYVQKSVNSSLVKFKKEIAEKRNPQIALLKVIDLENNMLVLRSAFENGHMENLDPTYITKISLGSNAITRASKGIDNYNSSIDNALAGNNWNNDLIYTSDYELKEKYHWIIEDLEFLSKYLNQLQMAFEKGAIPGTKGLLEKE